MLMLTRVTLTLSMWAWQQCWCCLRWHWHWVCAGRLWPCVGQCSLPQLPPVLCQCQIWSLHCCESHVTPVIILTSWTGLSYLWWVFLLVITTQWTNQCFLQLLGMMWIVLFISALSVVQCHSEFRLKANPICQRYIFVYSISSMVQFSLSSFSFSSAPEENILSTNSNSKYSTQEETHHHQ